MDSHLGYNVRIPSSARQTMQIPSDAQLREQAQALGERLRAAHDALVTAESCTGGWIAKCLTDIAGSSDWFDSGMVVYSYEAKQALLGVRPQTLEEHGAVSRETVIEMVSGALVHSGAGVAVAVTGIAGPGGGSAEKPVGLVYFAVAGPQGVVVEEEHFSGQRSAIKTRTVNSSLDLLRRYLQKIK